MSLPRRAPFWCSRRRPRTPRTRSPRIGQDRLQLGTGLVHLSQPEAVHRRQGAAADRYLGGIEALPELDRRLRGRQPEIGQPTDPGRDRDKHQHLGDDRQVTGRRKSQLWQPRGDQRGGGLPVLDQRRGHPGERLGNGRVRCAPSLGAGELRGRPEPALCPDHPPTLEPVQGQPRHEFQRGRIGPGAQQRGQRGTHRRRREDRNVTSAARSATIAQARGASSDGFHTTVFPATRAWAMAIELMSVGKSYGATTATTPMGRGFRTRRLLFDRCCVEGDVCPLKCRISSAARE